MLGRHLAERFGVLEMFDYREGNVFERKTIEGIDPTLTIVSGLSVYHNDATFDRFLYDVHEVIPEGSHIVIDNQIYNPSSRLMEKLATTTYGGSWTLFYRTREAMERMVSKYFRIENSSLDEIKMIHLIEAIKNSAL